MSVQPKKIIINVVGVIAASLIYVVGSFVATMASFFVIDSLMGVPVISFFIKLISLLQDTLAVYIFILFALFFIAFISMLIVMHTVSTKIGYFIFGIISTLTNIWLMIGTFRASMRLYTIIDIIGIFAPFLFISAYIIHGLYTSYDEKIEAVKQHPDTEV